MITFVGCIALAAGIIYLVIYGVCFLSTRTDVHVTGNVDHRVSGRIEHYGTVRQQIEYSGTVRHVHEIDPVQLARLERMEAAGQAITWSDIYEAQGRDRLSGQRLPALPSSQAHAIVERRNDGSISIRPVT